jgi:hypothetical protein
MKRIPLTRGLFAQVDDEDYEELSRTKWSLLVSGSGGKYGTNFALGLLHRHIMGAPEGSVVDHRNGDGLDCRRENMRICSSAENSRNRKRRVDCSSGFKGVCYRPRLGRWVAEIHAHGHRHYLGVFSTPEGAAAAYDAKAIELHGEFAKTNEVRNG